MKKQKINAVSSTSAGERYSVINGLYRCSCGCASFLRLPCSMCGETLTKRYVDRWKSARARYRLTLLRRILLPCLGLIVLEICCAAVFGLSLLFYLMAALTPAAAIVMGIYVLTVGSGVSALFWMLRDAAPVPTDAQTILPVDSAGLEPVMDAYYSDLTRLEHMAEKITDDKANSLSELLTMTKYLSHIYGNPRLSHLQLQLLMKDRKLMYTTDMNLLCAHLTPQDLEPEELEPALGLLIEWLLSGRYTESRAVRRLFETISVALLKRKCGDDENSVFTDKRFVYGPLIGHVMSFCVCSADGLCYSDIEEYGIADLVKAQGYPYADLQDEQWRTAPIFTAGRKENTQ